MKDYLVKLRNKLFGVNAVLAAIQELKEELRQELKQKSLSSNFELAEDILALSQKESRATLELLENSYEIETNTTTDQKLKDSQLNVYNFQKMLEQPPSEYNFIRFDPNNNCNLHCVYCHNERSNDIIDTEELKNFLENKVINTNSFQVGCIMEPTLDPRLCDLMLMIAHSPAKPKDMFILQTNGILLNNHDYEKMRKAGLTHLSVSIDSDEPETQKALRSGTNLNRVISNLKGFRQSCPETEIIFITTVTSANIQEMEDLVNLGIELGVNRFSLREIFYHPESKIVDHEKMLALLLKDNEFSKMKHNLIEKFGTKVNLFFADNEWLKTYEVQMMESSLRV